MRASKPWKNGGSYGLRLRRFRPAAAKCSSFICLTVSRLGKSRRGWAYRKTLRKNTCAGYKFENFRIDAGIDNIFDKLYYPPLGGIALDETYRPWVWGAPAIKRPIPGMGRSVWAGASVEF